MPGHDRYLELAAAAIDFELAPAEAAALATHLAACTPCRRDAAGILEDARALRRLSDGLPSAAVRERVLSAGGTTQRRRFSPLVALAAAATLVVAVIGGLSAGALLQTSREIATIPQPEWSHLVAADGFPSGDGQSGILDLTGVTDMAGVHLVAVGTGRGDGRVWVSQDGQAWTREDTSGLAAARPVAVASAAGRLIAAGYAVVGGDSVATAWVSTDARTWQATSFPGSTGLAAVAASPARIVVAGAGRSGRQLPIWMSRDGGRSWTRGSQTTPYTRASVAGIAVGGPGFVAVGSDDVGAVAWTSSDGLTWRRVDDPSFGSRRMTAVASTAVGLVAVGADQEGSIAWTSLDGVAWTPTGLFGSKGAWPTSVAATGIGLIAVGGVPGVDRVWTSEDGRDWRPVTNDSWAAASGVEAVVGRGSLVVIAGASDGRAGVWLGRPPAGQR